MVCIVCIISLFSWKTLMFSERKYMKITLLCCIPTCSTILICMFIYARMILTEIICGQPRPTTASPATTTGSDCFIPTRGGTARSESVCIFPFEYKGVIYTGCSVVDNNGVPWCYTSYDYRNDHLWGNCGGRFWWIHKFCTWPQQMALRVTGNSLSLVTSSLGL